MKKVVLILIVSLLLIITLFLVFNKFIKEKPFYLDDEYYKESLLTEINSDEFKDLEKDKKSFVVFAYDLLCPTSFSLNDYLIEFSDTYKISIYKISFQNIQDTSIANYVKYCPSVIIYHDGKLVAYLDSSSNADADYFKSAENFKNWFIKYVLLK